MGFLAKEELIRQLQNSFQSLIDTYDIDEIGIFEEEGQADQYYLGYTIKKDDNAYMIHLPYIKNDESSLIPLKQIWTLESNKPNVTDTRGYDSLNELFNKIV